MHMCGEEVGEEDKANQDDGISGSSLCLKVFSKLIIIPDKRVKLYLNSCTLQNMGPQRHDFRTLHRLSGSTAGPLPTTGPYGLVRDLRKMGH